MVPGMGVQIQHVCMCQCECVNVTELIVVNRPGTSGTLPDFVPLSEMAPLSRNSILKITTYLFGHTPNLSMMNRLPTCLNHK